MSRAVKIDFVSDVVCPWCALGATALEQAIENLAGEVDAGVLQKFNDLLGKLDVKCAHFIESGL